MPQRAAIEKLVIDTWAARRVRDCTRTMAHFHPEATFRIAGSPALGPFCATVKGSEVTALMRQLIDTWDLSGLNISSISIDGDMAFVHHRGRAVFIPANTPMDTEVLDVIRVQDGKIIEFVQFLDTYTIAKIAGIA